MLSQVATNPMEQGILAAIIIMMLSGIGWLIREILKLTPTIIDKVMDRLDKQETARNEGLKALGDRIEKAINTLVGNCRRCQDETRDQLDEISRIHAAFVANLTGGNGDIEAHTTREAIHARED